MKTKKFLGQHFLTSEGAVNALVDTARLEKEDTVLEIGPGKGALTKKLLETGVKVVAVEKDPDLIPDLQDQFESEITSRQFALILGDVLEINLSDLNLSDGTFKLVANIPYNITGKIIRNIIGGSIQPSRAVLVVQKEVAERIIARDNKESLLSLAVKAYGEPKYIKTIKSGSFAPPPEVDSAIIAIENISRNLFNDIDEEPFFSLIHMGFAHKRKQLQTNLSVTPEVFEKCGIAPETRAEELKPEDWKCFIKEDSSRQRG